MENNIVQGNLIGYYHFTTKDKSKTYYIIQAMVCKAEPERNNMRSTVLTIFTNEDIYKKIIGTDIGSKIDIEIIPNLETGKINYKVMI